MTFDEFYDKYKTKSNVINIDKEIIKSDKIELNDSTIVLTMNKILSNKVIEVFTGVVDKEYKRVVSPLLASSFNNEEKANNYYDELKQYNDLYKLDIKISS